MTLAELIEDVLENVSSHPKAEQVTRGEIKRLLNLAMREVSVLVGAPQLLVTVPSSGLISGPFQLPNRFRADGPMRAEVIEGYDTRGLEMRERALPIYSPATAQEFHPRWEVEPDEYCGPPFLVYSAAMPDAGFTPVGVEEARYRFLVHAVPEEMVEDSDEPFSVLDYCEEPPVRRPGAMPDYHRVLAHYASYELLQRWGDERWQAFYARYTKMQQELFARVSPTHVYLPGYRPGVSRG